MADKDDIRGDYSSPPDFSFRLVSLSLSFDGVGAFLASPFTLFFGLPLGPEADFGAERFFGETLRSADGVCVPDLLPVSTDVDRERLALGSSVTFSTRLSAGSIPKPLKS